jgi:RNA polymerase sigma-70 factor (ECF subfamily)
MSRHYPAAEASQSTTDELTLLIRDCLAQSRGAQKRLYDRFSPITYGIIRRYMDNDTAVAQEILNDVFYKVFTKLSQYSFNGSFEGWIRKIAVNTIADHVKKNMKVKVSGKEMADDDIKVSCNSVENISYKELLNLVQTLPELQRIILIYLCLKIIRIERLDNC